MLRSIVIRRFLSSSSTTAPPARARIDGLNNGLVMIRPATLQDTGRLHPGSVFRLNASSSVVVMFKMKDALFGCILDKSQVNIGDVLEQREDERLLLANTSKRVFDEPPRDMARKPITQSWFLNIPVMDLMTPIGMGQSMLFFEPSSSPLFTKICSQIDFASQKNAVFSPENETTSYTLDQDLDHILKCHLALAKAEVHRDAMTQGTAAVLTVNDLSPFRRIWERAEKMLPPPEASALIQRVDRSDLRHYYSTFIQRAARLKDGDGSLTMLLRVPNVEGSSPPDENKTFLIAEFERELKAGVRTYDDFERLVRLQIKTKGKIKITTQVLEKLQIPLPASAHANHLEFVEEATKARLHGEELMSIVDGHVVATRQFKDFLMDPRVSLTRIGVGSGANEVRDTRPLLIRSVARGLRIEIADLYDSVHANPEKAQRKLQAWKRALNMESPAGLHAEDGHKYQAALVWACRQGMFDEDAKSMPQFDMEQVKLLDVQKEQEHQLDVLKKCIK